MKAVRGKYVHDGFLNTLTCRWLPGPIKQRLLNFLELALSRASRRKGR